MEVPPLEVENLVAERFEGPQYVGVSAKGDIFILRTAGGLKVYPVDADGSFGKPRALQESPMGTPGVVLDAAMNRHGDWFILYSAGVRLFKSGKEVVLPELSWMPSSVALLDGEPIVATIPFPMGNVTRKELRHPPLLVSAGKDNWRQMADSGLDGPPDLKEFQKSQERYSSRLLADSDDTLWLANRYRYRLTRFSKAGKELLQLEVGDAEIKRVKEENMEGAREVLEEERSGYSKPLDASITMNTAVASILDLAEGEDGKIYLLTKGGEGGVMTLDRYDDVLGTLERTMIGMETPGAMSLASGKNGLYLIPFNGKLKRHMVSWEAIEAAEWVPVEGVKIDGSDAVSVAEGE